jgi:hypothetical protein
MYRVLHAVAMAFISMAGRAIQSSTWREPQMTAGKWDRVPGLVHPLVTLSEAERYRPFHFLASLSR